MSKESDEFEIMITRIHEILEESDSIVEWNEKIPDPDNPNQPRQIDITVRDGTTFNIIECRLHKAKQDVKWIEELIGRRLSLEANSVTAVSLSGFTKGAVLKAEKHGVVLRDLVTLTKEEIKRWSRGININLIFYRYSEFSLELVFGDEDLSHLDTERLNEELHSFRGFPDLFTAHLEQIEKKISFLDLRRSRGALNFEAEFSIEGFVLLGHPVLAVISRGKAHLEDMNLTIPEHAAYGDPSTFGAERDVYIQNYNMGKTRVIHHEEDISISLDLSKLETPPYWQFRYMETKGSGTYNCESLELVSPEKVFMPIDKIKLTISKRFS